MIRGIHYKLKRNTTFFVLICYIGFKVRFQILAFLQFLCFQNLLLKRIANLCLLSLSSATSSQDTVFCFGDWGEATGENPPCMNATNLVITEFSNTLQDEIILKFLLAFGHFFDTFKQLFSLIFPSYFQEELLKLFIPSLLEI